jgi:hypothetical protein
VARFFEALKAGWKGFKEANNPTAYAVAGKPVRCPHCGGSEFAISDAMLNSRIRTGFGADWADPSASILICAECGRIEWYAQEPTAI